MPKRKREDGSVEAEGAKQKSLRTLQAEAKVHHGQNLIHRAFKTAKGFERQKLGRRRKTALSKKDDKDVARIDAETEALKAGHIHNATTLKSTLDFNKAASNYLAKTLLKIKAISESPDRPSNLTLTSQSSDPAVLNVTARLCKSNPVREVLPKILSDVETALGVASKDGPKKTAASKNESRKASKIETSDVSQSDDGQVISDPRTRNGSPDSESEEDDFAGFSDGDLASDDDDDDDDEAFAAFDSRLASSSDSDDENGPPRSAFDVRALLQAHRSEDEANDFESDISDSPQPKKGTSRKQSAKEPSISLSPSASPSPPPPTIKPNASAFLPSLTMGGYISGSESAEDVDEPVKKNRRGQRARQAIWEKKFGKEAKHVKDGGKDGGKGGRNEGWDAKRGATEGGRGGRGGKFGRGGRGGGMSSGRGAAGSGANGVAVGKSKAGEKHRDDDGPLHPSWIAAKKRKEEKDKMAMPFQGKKITFD
ncbi:Protein bud22 [Elsinoe australis]|uniref:Protein bud22 n=1 Tax=Elsinoe australis TaxID=40998 RepID=A0A2P8A2S4_9PEZI|nr:Protein bud22 [Elsinoe australis]